MTRMVTPLSFMIFSQCCMNGPRSRDGKAAMAVASGSSCCSNKMGRSVSRGCRKVTFVKRMFLFLFLLFRQWQLFGRNSDQFLYTLGHHVGLLPSLNVFNAFGVPIFSRAVLAYF